MDSTNKPAEKTLDLLTAASPRAYAAYVATAAERDALADDVINRVNMNVELERTVSTVLGAVPGVQSHRDGMARLPDAQIEKVDKLETFALALQYTQGMYLAAVTPPEALTAKVAEGIAERDRFVSVAEGLVKWELLQAENVAKLRNGTSQRAVGADLIAIHALFRSNWSKIEGQSPVTLERLEHILALGEQILALVGLRDHAVERANSAARDRRRAFTLLDDAYDTARRHLTWLRWHEDDVEEIAPSIHAHVRRASKSEEPAAQPAEPTEPTRDEPHAAPSDPTAPAAPSDPTAPKLPRSNPFTK